MTQFEIPTGPGIRVDAGVRAGSTIPGFYDSLMAKLIVKGPNREVALRRAQAALAEMRIQGVRTVLPFHKDIVTHPAFCGDDLHVYTDWVDKEYEPGIGAGYAGSSPEDVEDAYTERTTLTVEIDGRLHRVSVPSSFGVASTPSAGADATSTSSAAGSNAGADKSGAGASTAGNAVECPYTGVLVKWQVSDGDSVEVGQPIATIEAMKMESTVEAKTSGTITLASLNPGDNVSKGDALGHIA